MSILSAGWPGSVFLSLIFLTSAHSPLPASAFTATGGINQYFSGGGNPDAGIGTNTSTGATWVQGFDNGAGLEARNFSIAGDGLLSNFAAVTLNWAGWSSGSLESFSSGSIAERVWRSSDRWLFEGDSVMLTVGFIASGSVSAYSDSGDTSGAGIGYRATIGNGSTSGSKQISSSGGETVTGDWGMAYIRTILYRNSDLYLFLEGYAYAGAGKTYLAFPVTGATGNFSHTLRWAGVQKIESINPDGSYTEIPGAYLNLSGDLSGFNYFYAAPSAGDGIPEPGSMMLLGGGLIALGWRFRSRLASRSKLH